MDLSINLFIKQTAR